MKVTRNRKGFISEEQAIGINWLPQRETWLTGQSKDTKVDLGSAAPDGAESTPGSGQGFLHSHWFPGSRTASRPRSSSSEGDALARVRPIK